VMYMPAAGWSGDMPLSTPAPFPVPLNLRAGAAHGSSAELQAWVTSLPDLVGELGRRWGLELFQPFQPGGSGSWVAPARDAAGREAVLKVGWTHTEARDEAEGLAVLDGEGAVEVYAYERDGPTTAILLERCRPGHELRTRPEREQHDVITELLRRLWHVRLPARHGFRPLQVMCDAWADQADTAYASHPGLLDPGVVREGLQLFRTLPRTAAVSVLLCTDLHAGNVLAGSRRPWLLVDPKPYVGDPHYDVLQHLLNCPESLRRDPRGLLQHVSDLAGLDADRVEQWLFARCVQASPGRPSLARVVHHLRP
jgi:streptomycin 6-kinase